MRALFTPLLAVLLAGGVSAQVWVDAPPMLTARTGAAAAVLNGKLYVMGGNDPAGAPLETAEVFDPVSGWSPIMDILAARTDAAATVLDGRILLIGGRDSSGVPMNDVDVYDPEQNLWEAFGRLMVEREGLGAVTLDGVPTVLGGAGQQALLLESIETYAPASGWTLLGAMSISPARARFGAVPISDAIVLLGGFSTLGPLRHVHRYVPDEGLTVPLDSLPTARGGLSAATDGRRIYAVGGRDAFDAILADVDALVPGEKWEPLTALPEPREGAVAAVLDGRLYVAGGTGEFKSVLSSVVYTEVDASVETSVDPSEYASTLRVVGSNPSGRGTAFEVRTEQPGPARLSVIDALGREVAVLLDRAVGRETIRITWAMDVPAGVYVARLAGPGGVSTALITAVQ